MKKDEIQAMIKYKMNI